MITDTVRLTLLLFVDKLGVPLREVLSVERMAHYERIVERLVAANGDALDVLTADTTDLDRALIIKAAALVRCQLNFHQHED